MKNLFLFMAITLVGLGGCSEKRSQPLAIDNSLTQEEIAAGVLSPEVMWKMGRVGLASLSPDASRLLYTVTWYNMQENRGVTAIYVRDAASGEVAQLTDFSSNNSDPKWNADGSKIYFLSDRSGSSQIWEMAADGQNPRQLSKLDKDIEGFGVNPAGDKVFYVQGVQVADRKSSDIHPDMAESKARVYDDLMCRHWDRWDEGEYRHIFIAELTSGGIGKGVDIIGEGAEWDTPLAPYFDMSEIAWAPLPPRKIDGVSILPLIEGKKDANPRESFVYYYRKNDLEAVTDGMFKLVFPHKYVTYGAYEPGNDGQPGKLTNLEIMKPEMYDLRRDPGERYNVITQYPEEAAKLMKIADQKRHELGDDLTRMKGTERREPGLVQGKKRHDL
mgnify:CR=1 FL=1